MTRMFGVSCVALAMLCAFGSAGQDDPPKTKGDFEAFFKKLDTDMDGKLDKKEFLQMADRAKEKDKAREKLAKVYETLDKEMKGITKEQLKKYLEVKKKTDK